MRKKACRLTAILLAVGTLYLCGCGKMPQGKGLTTVEVTQEPESSPALQAAPADSWYGYWYMQNTSGDWKDMNGYWWDCCAELSGKNGQYSLLLWDEDMPKERYLALMELEQREDGFHCTGGDFLDAEIKAGLVTVKLEEGLLNISGSYDEPEYGRFEYSMILRPWGDEWPDDERRPYYYESWYLPRIEAGESVPAVMNIK